MTWLLWLSIGVLVAVVLVRVMPSDSAYKEISGRLSRDTPLSRSTIFGGIAVWAVLVWPLAVIALVAILVRARNDAG
ncbi:hypothetical protein ACIA49_38760 [Kribbella sp. NPDC051587]|uniref:hypothetical protein n=1 Tax=Kribbella sp. NPDC051587 TaxID=3364119 RepID=UPI003793DB08